MATNVMAENKAMTRTQRNILLMVVIGFTLTCIAGYNLVKS